jgi:hypothetical protein
MIFRKRWAALAFLLSFGALSAAESDRLSAEQMKQAIRDEAITIPTPGELFAALTKPGKPNWSTQYRGPIPTNYRNRAQIALNLGGLIADGFIAVEAQDSQQVKNVGADIIKMAKALGVSENLLGRGNSINQFAENNEWSALHEELEATQNEVKASMQTHRDHDLIIMVSVGGWIRGTQVVSALLTQNYDGKSAKVLRQPALIHFIHAKMDEVSPELQNEPLVKEVSDQLVRIETLVACPAGKGPTAEDVRKLNEVVSKLTASLQNRSEPK